MVSVFRRYPESTPWRTGKVVASNGDEASRTDGVQSCHGRIESDAICSTLKKRSNPREQRFPDDGTDAIPDLTEGMPLRAVELEPVGKALKPRRFSRCDNARRAVMDRADGLKASSIRGGTGTQRRAKTVEFQSGRARDGIRGSRSHSVESLHDRFRMERT